MFTTNIFTCLQHEDRVISRDILKTIHRSSVFMEVLCLSRLSMLLASGIIVYFSRIYIAVLFLKSLPFVVRETAIL